MSQEASATHADASQASVSMVGSHASQEPSASHEPSASQVIESQSAESSHEAESQLPESQLAAVS